MTVGTGRGRAGGRFLDDVRDVLPAWVVARLLVGAAWVAAVVVVHVFKDGVTPFPMRFGLGAWDGGFYSRIAAHGYDPGWEGLRFFPGFPLAGRALSPLFLGSEPVALYVLANVAALPAAALVARLTRMETGDAVTGRRAGWLIALVPPAFVLSWAYSEALLILTAAGCFLALRRGRWGWGAVAGFLAGFLRPTGALLAIPALIEALSAGGGRRRLAARLAAIAAPAAGSGLYLLWVQQRYGDGWSPIRLQSDHRGDLVDPLSRLVQGLGELVGSERFNDGLHIPFAFALVVLTVLVWRWLPVSYAAFATAVVVIALSADNLNSLERYGLLNGFPLVMAIAIACRRPAVERAVMAVCAAGLVALCTMAWVAEYTP